MMKMTPPGFLRPLFLCLLAAITGIAAGRIQAGESKPPPLWIGVDANYSLEMEKGGAAWTWAGKTANLFEGMAKQGVREFRVRLWTKDEGPHGKAYATEVVQRALRAGLNPYLVLFLSDDWADLMKQPLPSAWKGLSFEERASAIRTYSREIVTHFRKAGLQSHLYEIGNEIDYGICGEYPGKGTKKNPPALSKHLWPRSAELLRASQAGVKEADPEAKFLLHIAHWWDADFCVAFFRFMLDHGVQIDYAGLSYFPSSNIGGSLEMDQFGATVSRLANSVARPVIVAEAAYPSTRDFTGQFSRWKTEVLGYPLTPEGQRRWVLDFLTFCHGHPDIHAVYYWSPEWYGEGMWKGFALFDPEGKAKPAWAAFSKAAWEKRIPKESVYVEVNSNQLFVVPVREAKEQMVPLIKRLREKTGGVTVEHIALLTQTELKVGSYAAHLKASLQQNLSLELMPGSEGISLVGEGPAVTGGLKAIAAGINPTRMKLVLILRNDSTPEIKQAITFFEQKGIQVDVHPKHDEAPLKFGMCGAFTY
ncbi:MAG: arabinogalactan endo-1,4-beta-galactosidase [Verrucomicrobia bacterium]|nr:arabinogalactan endo-1,4-beta-galactosidase [Verrucomicrobiota bacterium]